MPKPIKILVINGSHRCEKGFTQIALNHFLNGTKNTNSEYKTLYPSKKKIISCKSCGRCLFETPGICMLKDDMNSIIKKIDNSDILVFSSPVYFDSIPSDLKKMIDRLRVMLDAYFEFRDGRTFHLRHNANNKKVILILTAGNPEEESLVSTSRVFNRIIKNMGWELLGEFHFPASHLLVEKPELLSMQMKALNDCGKELILKGKIQEKLIKEANKNYIDNPREVVTQMTQNILKIRELNSLKYSSADK